MTEKLPLWRYRGNIEAAPITAIRMVALDHIPISLDELQYELDVEIDGHTMTVKVENRLVRRGPAKVGDYYARYADGENIVPADTFTRDCEAT